MYNHTVLYSIFSETAAYCILFSLGNSKMKISWNDYNNNQTCNNVIVKKYKDL